MKNTLLVLGIVIVAILAMGLPYILRKISVKLTTQQSTQPTIQTPTSPTLTIPQALALASLTINDFKFSSQVITVKKGTKVTWTNNDAVGHTVTGDNGGPASSLLHQGATYSYTFDTVGTYKYHCSLHPFMTATLEVTN